MSLIVLPRLFAFQLFELRAVLKTEQKLRIIIGVTGASGSIYPLRLLKRLASNPRVETHLILSRAGQKTLYLETGKLGSDLKALADFCWPLEDIAAPLASGSFQTAGMIISPCSIHTMSAIATGISSNLMIRAADVILKERRRLILMVRETPFHLGHLRTMTALTEMGAIVAPPIPGFYNNPATIEDLVDSSVDRVLDLIGLDDPATRRWAGPERSFPHSSSDTDVS
ncbi:MAG: 3-octaprenyl-4-hydroxybenzoate carboxy-lyase [Bryobacterales bacterium]|nr:3-octaprenyl-4-hydroxybenzoate carboxy-lyase [Bryobacterales bacterium]